MNKSAILPILMVLLAISIIIGFDLYWYHYITCTIKNYGVTEHDIIKRLDMFLFALGFETFLAVGVLTIASSYISDHPSGSAWPF